MDKLVREVNNLARHSILTYAIALGELIVGGVFGGDPSLVNAKGKRSSSFRALERHPELLISRTTLWRACQVFAMEKAFGVTTLNGLSASHCYAVIGLKQTVQHQLLADASEDGWTVAELQLRAQQHRRLSAGGHPRKSPVVRSLKQLHGVLTRTREALDAGEVDEKVLEDALKQLEAFRSELGELEVLLRSKVGTRADD